MFPFYITCLKSELEKRKRKNPRYSLRAFAAKLSLDPSFLSRILLRKQPLSPSAAQKICQTLELSLEEKRRFLCSVASEKRTAMEAKLAHSLSVPDLRPPVVELHRQDFTALANVQDYAILESTNLDQSEGTCEWIAQFLGMELERVQESVERLRAAGILTEENGRLKKVTPKVITKHHDEISDSLCAYQRTVFEDAAEAIESLPYAQRPTTTMVMAVDPDKIALAQAILRNFVLELSDFLESGKKTELYQTAISLFPLATEEKRVRS